MPVPARAWRCTALTWFGEKRHFTEIATGKPDMLAVPVGFAPMLVLRGGREARQGTTNRQSSCSRCSLRCSGATRNWNTTDPSGFALSAESLSGSNTYRCIDRLPHEIRARQKERGDEIPERARAEHLEHAARSSWTCASAVSSLANGHMVSTSDLLPSGGSAVSCACRLTPSLASSSGMRLLEHAELSCRLGKAGALHDPHEDVTRRGRSVTPSCLQWWTVFPHFLACGNSSRRRMLARKERPLGQETHEHGFSS